MSWIDTVITQLQQSDKVSPETLVAVSDFLHQHEALIDAATDEARQAFVSALARGDTPAAFDALTAALTPAQILTLLQQSDAQAAALVAARQATMAQFQSALDAAGQFAIGLLAKAAFSLL